MKQIGALALLSLCLAACCPGWGQGDAPAVKLEYAPKVGESEESTLTGRLVDIELAGAEFPEAASTSGVVKREVTKLDDETGAHTLQVHFEDAKERVQSAELVISPRGEVVPPPDDEKAAPLGDVQALASGGLPIGSMASLVLVVSFPEEPVKVGDSWTVEGETNLPVLGATKAKTTTTLVRVEGPMAYLESDMTADVPAFETENDMIGTVKIESGKVRARKIEREFDMERSLVVRSKGSIDIEVQADIGFGPIDIAATAEFDLSPVAKTKTKPADETPETNDKPAPAAEPKPEPEAKLPTLNIGPLSASAGRSDGVASVGLGVDMARAWLPKSLQRYRALADATSASCRIDIGLSREKAGTLALAGKAALGPISRDKRVMVDLKVIAARVRQAVLAVVGRDIVTR